MNAIQKFRLGEFKTFPKYLKRNGPLPAKATPIGTIRLPNPFIAHKNPLTGRWAPPKYSLRRQADLVKQAKAANTLHLLPPGLKFDSSILTKNELKKIGFSAKPIAAEAEEVWRLPIDWEGKPKTRKMAGADIGARLYAGKRRMFKGHKWERLQKKTMAHRKILLASMKQRIFDFKHHHKFRKPHPTAVPKLTSYSKIPF
ncbi:hypothetical protein C8J56DRAFT_1015167 [Mycena floridula]|nr:hypothetical protein C8J56DRAFT_1015167 [Mycena floridula]